MIKKIIFDLDNTLIKWEDEKNWYRVYEKIKKNYQITPEEFQKIRLSVEEYEKNEDIFNEEKMQKKINNAIGKNLNKEFVQTILKIFADCIPDEKDSELDETLQYLICKYELVILTNWFTWPQEERLEKYGIRKYFTKVHGADKFKLKPNRQAFEVAIGDNKITECIMIGDGIVNDIEGAKKIGLDAILLVNNCNDAVEQIRKQEYRVIKNIGELKQIL